jgi:threonine/homoserine efflux transporter RhtA
MRWYQQLSDFAYRNGGRETQIRQEQKMSRKTEKRAEHSLGFIFQMLGAVFQRVATLATQPLTAAGSITAPQAAGVTYLFAAPTYILLLRAVRGRLKDEVPLSKATPKRTLTKKFFASLLRRTESLPWLHSILAWIAKMEEKHPWVVAIAPSVASLIGGSFLAPIYAQKLPFAAGESLKTLGPTTCLIAVALWEKKRGLPLYLPFVSAAGAAIIFFGSGQFDYVGILAAIGAGVCSAVSVNTAKNLVVAKISIRAMAISMAVGLLIGILPLISLIGDGWTWEVTIRGAGAGALVITSSILYYVAQKVLQLPKSGSRFVSTMSPVLSGVVAFFVLHESVGLVKAIGMGVILAAALTYAFTAKNEKTPTAVPMVE